jgi:catechol 2,3-dioxygenase-like lactoylglutathione lyase family enzyme
MVNSFARDAFGSTLEHRMFRRLDRLVIRVPNLASAVAYYRDVLGLTLVRQENRVASLRFDDHDCGEIVLHSDPDLPSEATYVLVDSVRDLYQRRAQLRLKFTAPPARVTRGYRATVKDPFGTILHLLDRSDEGRTSAGDDRTSRHVEDVRPPGALFDGVPQHIPAKRTLLIQLYEKLGRTADDLPYTPHFESLYEPYIAGYHDPKPDRAEVWRHLLNIRKAGKLPKLGEARSKPPDVSDEARELLRDLLGDDIGKRDRLPYSARFAAIVEEFNKTQARKLSPHLVWRLVATLAK